MNSKHTIVAIFPYDINTYQIFETYYVFYELDGYIKRIIGTYSKDEILSFENFTLPEDKSFDDMLKENITPIGEVRMENKSIGTYLYYHIIKETEYTYLLINYINDLIVYNKNEDNYYYKCERFYTTENLNFIENL